MEYSLNKARDKKIYSKIFIYFLVLMAIFLNQSEVLFGVNLSFSDFFCIIILIILIIKGKLSVPLTPTLYFLLVSIVVLFTSVFYVPNILQYNTQIVSILKNYIKLIAIFIYFIVGYSISKLNLIDKVLKWYSVFALIIGIIGVIFTILNIQILRNILFFGNIRLRGLMNDPNYFSVVQTTALSYFVRTKKLKIKYKYLSIFILILSVIASGSKTGFVTLFCYFGLLMLENVSKINWKWSIITIFVITVILLFLLYPSLVLNMIDDKLYTLESVIPAFNRIEPLLKGDINEAIFEGGSNRNLAWLTALQIIKLSPILGIGIGTYSNVAKWISGSNVIAHNTYLQLFSEWGMLLATIFFVYIIYILSKVLWSKKKKIETNVILKDTIIILLIASLAISLNNARMFWLFFGSLVFNVNMYD